MVHLVKHQLPNPLDQALEEEEVLVVVLVVVDLALEDSVQQLVVLVPICLVVRLVVVVHLVPIQVVAVILVVDSVDLVNRTLVLVQVARQEVVLEDLDNRALTLLEEALVALARLVALLLAAVDWVDSVLAPRALQEEHLVVVVVVVVVQTLVPLEWVAVVQLRVALQICLEVV